VRLLDDDRPLMKKGGQKGKVNLRLVGDNTRKGCQGKSKKVWMIMAVHFGLKEGEREKGESKED